MPGTLEVFAGQVIHDVRLTEIAVGPGDVGGQGQLRGLLVDFGGTGLAEGRFPGIALAAPQVEVVVEAGADIAKGGVRVTLPERVLVPGQARAADTGAGIQGRHPLGVGCGSGSAGLMGTGVGDLHVRAVAQGLADQTVELRVAEAFPPVAFRPGGRRQGHAAEGLPGLEVFRVEADTFGFQAAVTGATGQAHGQQHQAQAGTQGFTAHLSPTRSRVIESPAATKIFFRIISRVFSSSGVMAPASSFMASAPMCGNSPASFWPSSVSTSCT
ncbi:hypothetical protein D3C78_828700 [compost metagenome]